MVPRFGVYLLVLATSKYSLNTRFMLYLLIGHLDNPPLSHSPLHYSKCLSSHRSGCSYILQFSIFSFRSAFHYPMFSFLVSCLEFQADPDGTEAARCEEKSGRKTEDFPAMEFRVSSLGCPVEGLGFRIEVFGCKGLCISSSG